MRLKNALWWSALVFIAAIVVGVALLGWFAFVIPLFIRVQALSTPLLLVFAFIAGFILFYSPCAITVLPAYVSYFLKDVKKSDKRATSVLGAKVGLGMISLYSILGAFVIMLGRLAAVYVVEWSKPIMGVLFLVIGLGILSGFRISTDFLHQRVSKFIPVEKAKKSPVLFGFLYSTISLCCGLLFFIPLVVFPLVTGSVTKGVLVFLLFSMAVMTSAIVNTFLIVTAKELVIRRVLRSAETLKKVAAVLFILVGLYLVLFSLYIHL